MPPMDSDHCIDGIDGMDIDGMGMFVGDVWVGDCWGKELVPIVMARSLSWGVPVFWSALGAGIHQWVEGRR
jgi:hypothetical protein